MTDENRQLTAHLLRRAGFGASVEDLDRLAGRTYEDIVEELVHPERVPEVPEDIISRYIPHTVGKDGQGDWNARWMYRMTNSHRPL